MIFIFLAASCLFSAEATHHHLFNTHLQLLTSSATDQHSAIPSTERATIVIQDPSNHIVKKKHNGKMVFFSVSPQNIQSSSSFMDEEFGIHFKGAFKVRRIVEYCQWIELPIFGWVKDRNGEDHFTIVKYSYTERWTSGHIPSLLFHNPLKYHNPFRNVYANAMSVGSTSKFGPFTASHNLTRNIKVNERKINFHRDSLKKFTLSKAAIHHKFTYVGSGYFFSAHSPKVHEKALSIMSEIFESYYPKVIDFGELFSTCTAGDLRVYYTESKPSILTDITVYARQVNEHQGFIEQYTCPMTKRLVGGIREGIFNKPEELLQVELDEFYYSIGGVMGSMIFAVFITLIEAVFLSQITRVHFLICFFVVGSLIMTLSGMALHAEFVVGISKTRSLSSLAVFFTCVGIILIPNKGKSKWQ